MTSRIASMTASQLRGTSSMHRQEVRAPVADRSHGVERNDVTDGSSMGVPRRLSPVSLNVEMLSRPRFPGAGSSARLALWLEDPEQTPNRSLVVVHLERCDGPKNTCSAEHSDPPVRTLPTNFN